jgi:hypothetical protein
LTEKCKVIKLLGYIRMVLSKDLLSNLQCPFAEGLCFLVLPSFPIKNGQIVEGRGHLRQSFMLGHLNRTQIISVHKNVTLLYKKPEQKNISKTENSGLLGCDTVWWSKEFLTFQINVPTLSLKVQGSLTVTHHLPSDETGGK